MVNECSTSVGSGGSPKRKGTESCRSWPTLAKPTLANRGLDRLWPNRLWPILVF